MITKIIQEEKIQKAEKQIDENGVIRERVAVI